MHCATSSRRLEALTPADGRLLHATLRGPIPARADVENLLLYNVLSGRSMHLTRSGVRFEHDPRPSPAWTYRYELADPDEPFRCWAEGAPVAQLHEVPIVSGSGERLLARTWWSLRSHPVELRGRLDPRRPFAVRLQLTAPAHAAPTARAVAEVARRRRRQRPAAPPDLRRPSDRHLAPGFCAPRVRGRAARASG